MGKLVLQLPDGSSLDIPLDRERITIGRRADNDVCLPYPAVSGEHASVVTILDDSFLEDQNSTNGTLVNGKPIAKHFLRDGDEIDIGRQKLVYYSDGTVVRSSEDAPVKSGRTLRAARPSPRISMSETMPPPPSGTVAAPFAAPIGAMRPPLKDLHALLGEPDESRASSPPPPSATASPESFVDTSLPSVRVETGASAGRVVTMAHDELVIGRVGECVAALRRDGGAFRLVPVEGDAPVTINGARVPAEGSTLVSGDAFEVASTRLTFSVPGQ